MGSILFFLLASILMFVLGGGSRRTYPPTPYNEYYDPYNPYNNPYLLQEAERIRLLQEEAYRRQRQEENSTGCLLFILAILGGLVYIASHGM